MTFPPPPQSFGQPPQPGQAFGPTTVKQPGLPSQPVALIGLLLILATSQWYLAAGLLLLEFNGGGELLPASCLVLIGGLLITAGVQLFRRKWAGRVLAAITCSFAIAAQITWAFLSEMSIIELDRSVGFWLRTLLSVGALVFVLMRATADSLNRVASPVRTSGVPQPQGQFGQAMQPAVAPPQPTQPQPYDQLQPGYGQQYPQQAPQGYPQQRQW